MILGIMIKLYSFAYEKIKKYRNEIFYLNFDFCYFFPYRGIFCIFIMPHVLQLWNSSVATGANKMKMCILWNSYFLLYLRTLFRQYICFRKVNACINIVHVQKRQKPTKMKTVYKGKRAAK